MENLDYLDRATEDLVIYLKTLYGDWIGTQQFGNTPERLSKMYREFCWTPEKIEEELKKAFRTFQQEYDQMVVARDIDVWTLCPHHLLPCHFRVTIGYIPKGKVLGLSKFTRIADIYARRPIMQEEYSQGLADTFMKKLDPKGVAIHVVGSHGCMTSRGVKQHSDIITSTIRGVFENEAETRQEFFSICRS